jgi:hypothetical protein
MLLLLVLRFSQLLAVEPGIKNLNQNICVSMLYKKCKMFFQILFFNEKLFQQSTI